MAMAIIVTLNHRLGTFVPTLHMMSYSATKADVLECMD